MVQPEITVRKPTLPFERDIPHHYLGGNPVKTQFFNALNLAFPDGERFFVRAVNDHKARIEDPKLLAEIRAFSGQEGQHANQHERFFQVLARQGYEVDSMLSRMRRMSRWATRNLPRSLRLSMTAGAEHYTATLASLVFKHDLVGECDPTLRDLIEWHALEEIEHKHVAYDVLQKLYRYNYPLRILGYVVASLFVAAWAYAGTRELLLQDGRARRLSLAGYRRARNAALADKTVRRFRVDMRRALLDYLRPGFHPNQHDDTALLSTHRAVVEQRVLPGQVGRDVSPTPA